MLLLLFLLLLLLLLLPLLPFDDAEAGTVNAPEMGCVHGQVDASLCCVLNGVQCAALAATGTCVQSWLNGAAQMWGARKAWTRGDNAAETEVMTLIGQIPDGHRHGRDGAKAGAVAWPSHRSPC